MEHIREDSRRYQIFWVVSLERGPPSLVSAIEELIGIKTSSFGLERREYGGRDPSRWPLGTLYPQKLALTSPTSCGRSVGIVRSWTQATEFVFSKFINAVWNTKVSGAGISVYLWFMGRTAWVRFPAGASDFSLSDIVQAVPGAHPASNPVYNEGLSLGIWLSGREADHWLLSGAEVKKFSIHL
jgi:hypothetical protein